MPQNQCPSCGGPLSAHAHGGHCPRCLLRQGLESDVSGPNGETIDLPARPGSVLETIDASIGGVPRVMLRDTAPGEEPSPIIRPSNGNETSTRYRIDGEIARGGMGAILRGRDPDIGRDVAIKVLREDLRDNVDLVRRFVEEAQIGGQLQHPGVVPIYELGTFADQRPFFSMKLVKGQTLADLLASRSSPSDDLPRFLSIFAAMAQTMAYSHTRGVIHRDLKPSNVMVGSFGEVQVMDWGLAKVLARGGLAADAKAGKTPDTLIATARSGSDLELSHAGSILGTPSYMPPEQARGETEQISERADVFSLGAILGEILTGAPAFTGRTSGEILRKASRGDTTEALNRLEGCGVEGELIALARECLAPEPEDRPHDANVVAERITAYLAGVQERVQAAERERAVAVARAIEERKRRRVTLALAGSILALAALGGSGAFWMMQERRALAAQVNLALNEAEVRREQAQTAGGDNHLWISAREAARRASSLLGDKGSTELRGRTRDLVARIDEEAEAAHRDRRLLDVLADARAARMERGLATADLAYAAAFKDYQLDLDRTPTDVAARLFRARPGTFAVDVAAALDDWMMIRRARKTDPAIWSVPLSLARAIDPDPYREKLRTTLEDNDLRPHLEMIRRLAKDPQADELSPTSAILLAAVLVGYGDREAGVALLRKSADRHPDDLWVSFELAGHLLNLRPAQPDEAIRYFTAARALRPTTAHALADTLKDRGRSAESIAVFRDLERRQPADGTHSSCLGRELKDLGRADEARATFERAVIAFRTTLAANPSEAITLHNLGMALDGLGRTEEAISTIRASLKLEPNMAQSHSTLGVLLTHAGRPDEAEAAYREALRIEPSLLTARSNLATQMQYKGKLDEAIAEFRTLVGYYPHLAILHYNLGNALWAHQELESAAAEQREALRLDPDHIEARINLGCITCDLGLKDEGIKILREAARRRPEHPQVWDNLIKALYSIQDFDAIRELERQNPGNSVLQAYLGKALFDRDKYEEALGPLEEAVRLDAESTWVLTMLGVCQAKLNHYDQAIDILRRAAKRSPDDANVWLNLGSSFYGLNKHEEAIAAFQRSLHLDPNNAHTHASLAHALFARGDRVGSVSSYKEAIRLEPTEADFRYWLGRALEESNANADSILAYREAIRIRADYPEARDHLGVVLYKNGSVDESLAVHREAVRLHPDRADARYGLGTIEMLKGLVDEAIASLREAIRLDPSHAESHCNLAQALKNRGQFDEALVHFRRGHELGSQQANWPYPSGGWVKECENLVEVEQFLRDVLAAKSHPEDQSQFFALGMVAYMKGLYATSADFYSGAIPVDPGSSNDPSVSSIRYRATCSAALAGSGKGKDDPPTDEASRAKLRSQAHDWLRADLKAWDRIAASAKPEDKAMVARTLAQWKADADLAGIRDQEALTKLPIAEREAFLTLWSDIEVLRKKAAGSVGP
jgi:tetratricopeptide (TPR) repeat protein